VLYFIIQIKTPFCRLKMTNLPLEFVKELNRAAFWMAFSPFITLSNIHHLMKKDDENILNFLLPLVYSIIPIYSWGCAYLVIFQNKGYIGE